MPGSDGYKKLEQYGIIGDLSTCALIGDDGSVDWYCLPHIESPSVFAAILDAGKGGFFRIGPKDRYESSPTYIDRTNVLRTDFITGSGEAELTDFMPVRSSGNGGNPVIYRRLACKSGEVDFEITFMPAFDYAREKTKIRSCKGGVAAGSSDGINLFLSAPFRFSVSEDSASADVKLSAGETVWIILGTGEIREPDPVYCERLLDETINFWLEWVHKCGGGGCVFAGPWHDQAVRSSLVLKLLVHAETGAICAAPTTSLPEEIGGIRNWDYRFNWLRDSSFTAQAFHHLGYSREAHEHLAWFRSLCSIDVADIKVLYTLHGEGEATEEILDHLSGYRGSKPVRIGNAAVDQRQIDIYGELVNSMYEVSRYRNRLSDDEWATARRIVDYVCRIWKYPDSGIWEIRDKQRHYVYSKLMCWVALDRGIKIAEEGGFEAPLEFWKKERDQIRDEIITRGYSGKKKCFIQHFDSESLDATSLLIPIMGLLPNEDPMVQGTIDATLRELTVDKLVYRYRSEDGLPGGEGAFVFCTCWLVDALALSKRYEEAEEIFLSLLGHLSPLGLIAEEIDPLTGEQLGNFPQAFSHVGIINSALYLGMVRGKPVRGPGPLGVHHDEKT